MLRHQGRTIYHAGDSAYFEGFKLSFESLDKPPRWLEELAHEQKLTHHLKILEEGVPTLF